jgi:hypothetical protein
MLLGSDALDFDVDGYAGYWPHHHPRALAEREQRQAGMRLSARVKEDIERGIEALDVFVPVDEERSERRSYVTAIVDAGPLEGADGIDQPAVVDVETGST